MSGVYAYFIDDSPDHGRARCVRDPARARCL